MNVTDDTDIIARLLRENEELKSALKAEKERNILPEEGSDYIYNVEECLQKIEENIEKMQENVYEKFDSTEKMNMKKFAELQRKISNVEDSISMFPYPQYVQHWLNSLLENGIFKSN